LKARLPDGLGGALGVLFVNFLAPRRYPVKALFGNAAGADFNRLTKSQRCGVDAAQVPMVGQISGGAWHIKIA
jgi:hypothetical protein